MRKLHLSYSCVLIMFDEQICCTIKDDLLTTLEQLVLHQDKFDYILIETTGLANPGPIIGTFWTDDGLDSCLKLDGVVCVVDSLNIEKYLETDDIATDVQLQVCYADRIILNKTDLVPDNRVRLLFVCFVSNCVYRDLSQMNEVESLIRTINGLASTQRSFYSQVDLDFVLNLHNYSSSTSTLETKSELISSQFFQCVPCETVGTTPNLLAQYNAGKPGHIPNDMRTHSFKIEGVIVLRLLQLCMDRLLYSNTYAPTGSHGGADPKGPTSEIYRVKGILHLTTGDASAVGSDFDSSVLYSLQAVHQLFEINPTSFKVNGAGDTTNGMNLFIFIGKNLDALLIESELRKCIRV